MQKKFENKFYNALEDIFIGAKIEGKGGFINLMNIKSKYYSNTLKPKLEEEINKRFDETDKAREDIFSKLYTFFKRYFSEIGSIYFQYTPIKENIYEKVYSNKEDINLFYKTHMLYYVKSEPQYVSCEIKVENKNTEKFYFFFDVSEMQNAKDNQKKEIIFDFLKIENEKIFISVKYSEKGNKTKNNEILKSCKELKLDEETLKKAFKSYKKQNEVDYFINKNTKAFLKEQFNLYFYDYIFREEQEGDYKNITQFTENRIRQLQYLKQIAFKIIDFISQFEDELVKIWNKPKFVRKSNYVLTFSKIKNHIKIIEKILNYKDFENQEQEWKDLGFNLEGYNKKDIIKDKKLNEKWQYLTIDTKYFEEIKYDILNCFENLDKDLDGTIIHSDNYQALNTLQKKYKGEIDLCYIDPPFNTGSDFIYKDGYQDSTWLTLMENKINLIPNILNDKGCFYLHLDNNANAEGKILLDKIFGKNNFINEIIWGYRSGGASKKESLPKKHDTIFLYSKSNNFNVNSIYERQYLEKQFMGSLKDENGKFYVDTLCRDILDGIIVTVKNDKIIEYNVRPVLNLSSEHKGFQTQKPEGLINILIDIAKYKEKIKVLDFFSGSGTTINTAHKLKHKWLGIEMGEHFNDFFYDKIEVKKTSMKKLKFEIVEKIEEKKNSFIVIVRKFGNKGRLKRTFYGINEGITKSSGFEGGGFLKYYTLEQYEEVLEKSKFSEDVFRQDLFSESKNIFDNYIFLKDLKLTGDTIEIDLENKKVKVDLKKLYDDIDIGETLSNLLGKKIKKLYKDKVIFDDKENTEIYFNDLDYEIIKPLIWWK